ncbi:MAG: N(G),N(G)-dimethylarginine dimethylaminohydrolase [Chloroflexi bacterium]|nr:MAG: N(G),N(G)-dimethylarginine dimethylaminohydrolase [Chloroflexota bacterium]MBL1193208.1 N(G),N(G)-dimethylarginine dimethylaminohydrolase [Chloroflexota bacterium]NOH10502.1 N(G),N(G)-dimethylarginine dimethylaminohydrolase [Chloroflexota bacterium]
MFTRAIVRKPGQSMTDGLRDTDIGIPDHQLALVQHAAYVEALKACGLDVLVLEADESYPDSTFVEDTALLTKACAIITNPGALSRKGEIHSIKQVLSDYYDNIEEVIEPSTVEGGDIMMVGSHFYIGLSERTNEEGARQVIAYLEKYGFSGSTMSVGDMLHLKSGVVYLEDNTIAATGEFVHQKEFEGFRVLEIAEDESYAANCIWVNGNVLVAKGYPKAAGTIADAGYPVIELDVSEFRKLDGGLSCLSLRF